MAALRSAPLVGPHQHPDREHVPAHRVDELGAPRTARQFERDVEGEDLEVVMVRAVTARR
jgi:hypothetical protein